MVSRQRLGQAGRSCQHVPAYTYLHKGSYVYVEGPLAQREWTGNDGAPHTTLEVRARELRLLDRRGEDHNEDGAAAGTGEVTATAPTTSGLEDVPF